MNGGGLVGDARYNVAVENSREQGFG